MHTNPVSDSVERGLMVWNEVADTYKIDEEGAPDSSPGWVMVS